MLQPAPRREKVALTLSLVGMLLYLWVIHYPAFPLGQTGIVVGLIGILLNPTKLSFPAPLLWFGAFVLWSALGFLQTEFPAVAQDGIIAYGKLWLIFLLGVNVAHNRNELRTLTIVWLAIFAFYPVRGTLFNIVFGISEFGRYSWNNIFENPNDLAALTLPMLALCIGLLQTERGKWVRIAATIGTVLLPVIIFFTQSRGGILALLLFGSLVLLRKRRQGRMLAMTAAAATFVAIAVPSSVWTRLGGLKGVVDTENLGAVDPYGSAEQRYEIWKVGAAIAADNLLFGTGPDTYPVAHSRYARTSRFNPTARGLRDTHSTYLNVLAESGVIGFILFMGMLGSVFLEGWRVMQRLRRHNPEAETQIRTLLIGLVAFLQASVFATTQHVAFLYLYLAIICVYLRLAPQPAARAAPVLRPSRGAVRVA